MRDRLVNQACITDVTRLDEESQLLVLRAFTFRVFRSYAVPTPAPAAAPTALPGGPPIEPHGRSLQCRPTDDLCMLQLRAVPDIVPVMTMVMHPAMMDVGLLNRA